MNALCPLGWAKITDIWSNAALAVAVKILLDEMNIEMCALCGELTALWNVEGLHLIS